MPKDISKKLVRNTNSNKTNNVGEVPIYLSKKIDMQKCGIVLLGKLWSIIDIKSNEDGTINVIMKKKFEV